MSTIGSRWDLDEVEVATSAVGASLSVVARVTRQKEDISTLWATAVR